MQRLLALGSLAAFVLATAACGAETVQREAASEAERGTARFQTVTRTTWSDDTETNEYRSSGVIDFGHDRSETHDEEGRTIRIGLVSYAALPSDTDFPPGRRWSRYDASESEAHFMELAGDVADERFVLSYERVSFSRSQSNPDHYLDYLRSIASELEQGAEEEIQGVATTHFEATLDNRKAWLYDLALLGWSGASIERFLLGQSRFGVDTTIDAWVDRDGRARRVVSRDRTWTVAADGTHEEWGANVTTTTFFDFGIPLDIQPPPEAEVVEWDELPDRQE